MLESKYDWSKGVHGTFAWADYLVFGGMLVASLAIGVFYAIRSRNKANEEFLMGGRSLTCFPVAMSLVASFISAILVLGSCLILLSYRIFYFFIIPYLISNYPVISHLIFSCSVLSILLLSYCILVYPNLSHLHYVTHEEKRIYHGLYTFITNFVIKLKHIFYGMDNHFILAIFL